MSALLIGSANTWLFQPRPWTARQQARAGPNDLKEAAREIGCRQSGGIVLRAVSSAFSSYASMDAPDPPRLTDFLLETTLPHRLSAGMAKAMPETQPVDGLRAHNKCVTTKSVLAGRGNSRTLEAIVLAALNASPRLGPTRTRRLSKFKYEHHVDLCGKEISSCRLCIQTRRPNGLALLGEAGCVLARVAGGRIQRAGLAGLRVHQVRQGQSTPKLKATWPTGLCPQGRWLLPLFH